MSEGRYKRRRMFPILLLVGAIIKTLHPWCLMTMLQETETYQRIAQTGAQIDQPRGEMSEIHVTLDRQPILSGASAAYVPRPT